MLLDIPQNIILTVNGLAYFFLCVHVLIWFHSVLTILFIIKPFARADQLSLWERLKCVTVSVHLFRYCILTICSIFDDTKHISGVGSHTR